MSEEHWKDEYQAGAHQVWVCAACGKTNANRVNVGDESCFMNAVLCQAEKVGGHWVAVEVKP